MFPYYLLISLPVFFTFIRIKFKSKRVFDRFPLLVFFVLFLILLSLRGISCGIDLLNYQSRFESVSLSSFTESIASSSFEYGYNIFVLVCKWFVNDFRFFLIICSLISVVPIMLLYFYGTEHNLLTISLFVAVAPFTMFFSGLRQAIAIGIGAICYHFSKKNKIIPFLIFAALAVSFHQSAVVLLLIYPLTHAKITKKWIIPISVLYIVIMVFNKSIFGLFLGLSEKYESRYIISDTGAYTYLIMLILFVIYSFIIPNEEDKELLGLRNLLVVALFIQCFAPINTVAMRLNYYFLIFIPILIPKIIDNAKPQFRKLANISSVVFICFFIFWFFKEAYTGSNILHVFPYIPFWEEI